MPSTTTVFALAPERPTAYCNAVGDGRLELTYHR